MEFGLFPTSSGSDQSGDKDTLIDEMTQKIGELLKCNQDLYDARKEIEGLNAKLVHQEERFRAEKASIKEEKAALRDEIAALKEERQKADDKIAKLEGHLGEIQVENEEMRKGLDDVEGRIKDIHTSSGEDVKQQVEMRTSEFKSSVENKDRKIRELSNHIRDLEATNARNMDIMDKQAQDLESTRVEVDRAQRDLQSLQKEIENGKERADHAVELLKKEKTDRKAAQKQLSSVKQERTEACEMRLQLQAEVNTKNDLIQDLQAKVNAIRALDAQAESFEEIAASLERKAKQATVLRRKYDALKQRYKKLVAVMQIREQEIAEAAGDLSDVQANAKNLQSRVAKTDHEVDRLSGVVKRLTMKASIGRVVAKAHKTVLDRVSSLEVAVNPNLEQPSFRSIIISALTLRRWRKIVGTAKEYEEDTRSWWWLERNHSRDGEIGATITGALKRVIELEASTKECQMQQAHAEIEQKEALVREDDLKELIRRYEDDMNKLQAQNEELSGEIDSMIDRNKFDALREKYSRSKQILKEVSEIVHDQESQIGSLSEQVQELEQQRKLQHSRLKLSAKTSKNVQNQLLQSQDEANILRLELSSKSREMISLERGVNHATAERDMSRAQTNVRLSEARLSNDDRPDYQRISQTDLGLRLREMSKSLSST